MTYISPQRGCSPYEALTLNQQFLILRGVLQSIVFQLRCEHIEVIIIGAQTVMRHNVLASPDILNGRLGLASGSAGCQPRNAPCPESYREIPVRV